MRRSTSTRNTLYGSIAAVLLALAGPSSAAQEGAQEAGGSSAAGTEKNHVLALVSEDPSNYEAHKTIPAFAEWLEHEHNLEMTVIQGEGEPEAFRFPGLEEVLPKADLVVVFFRRRALPHDQLAAIKGYLLLQGKPLVGIRTANHAFSVHGEPEAGHDAWWDFVPVVLGCVNRGYGDAELGTGVSAVPEVKDHPILEGVEPLEWHSNGSLYLVAPQVDQNATVLLTGKAGDHVEPIAWTRTIGRSRIFYTSLGYPDDFEEPQFRRLLYNGMRWAMGRP